MLFWIFVIVSIIGWFGYFYCDNHLSKLYFIARNGTYKRPFIVENFDYIGTISMVEGLISSFVVFLMAIVLCVNYLYVPSYIEKTQQQYEDINYQIQNNMYDNGIDNGKIDLMKEIITYNENLASKKNLQYDFWVGIFVPNIYDQFEFINLDDIE